jgi:hypothetical protein
MILQDLKTSQIFIYAGIAALFSCLVPSLFTLSNSYVGLIFAIVVIVFYHIFLFLRVKELNNDEIDTVYYLGFLVTLLAMAATIIKLANNIAKTDDNLIVEMCINFGIGLCATGYALLARMHLLLSPKYQDNENLNLENLEEKISESIHIIISKINIASDEFSSLTKSLQDNLISSNERGILQISRAFDNFSSIAENASIEISERIDGMQKSINNFDIDDKQRKINMSLINLVDSLKASVSSLDGFSTRVDIGKEKFQNLTSGVLSANNALVLTSEKMNAVGQVSDTLQNNLNELSIKAEDIGTKLKQDLMSVVPAMNEANLNIKNSVNSLAISLNLYSSRANSTGEGITVLNNNVTSLSNALSTLTSNTNNSNSQINREVLALVSNISSANLTLQNSINDLSKTLKILKDHSGNSDSQLLGLNTQLENLTKNISNVGLLSESFKRNS